MEPSNSAAVLRFGEWTIEPKLNRISRTGEERQLEPRTMDVLAYLMDHAGEVVSSDELLERFWPNRVVEEGTIHRCINRIRRSLGDDPRNPEYIETIVKRGYRAIGAVAEMTETADQDPNLLAALEGRTPPFPAYEGDEPYVFVCYAHDDREAVYAELSWMKAAGINIWYDEGIPPGSEWTEELGKAIDNCTHFLFFVTQNSAASRHCRDEVQFALKRETQVLTVFMESTELPLSLELMLGSTQALNKYDLDADDYRSKTVKSLTGAEHLTAETSVAPRKSRHLFAASIAVVALLAAAWMGYRFTSVQNEPQTMAVLAFANLSDDPNIGYLADGLAEELMDALFRVPGLRVASRTDSFSFRSTDATTKEIGEALGVSLVLEGSVRRSGGQLRIAAQLINTDDGFHVWSRVFDEPIEQALKVQQEIATGIVGTLGLDVPVKFGTDSDAAYALALEGMMHSRAFQFAATERVAAEAVKAVELLELALDHDPGYIMVYHYLADAYAAAESYYGVTETKERIVALLDRGIALNPDETTKRAFAGRLGALTYDWPKVELLHAAELRQQGLPTKPRPGFMGGVTWWYSNLLANAGLHEDALQFLAALEPIASTPDIRATIDQYTLWSLFALHRFDEAAKQLDDCYSQRNLNTWGTPGMCMLLRARTASPDERAAAFSEAASQLSGEYHHNAQLNAYLLQGDQVAAQAEFNALLERYPNSHESILSARLNFDVDEAFGEYQNATTSSPTMLVTVFSLIKSDPKLIDDPRFQDFRAHYNLTPEWTAELCRRVHVLGPEIGIKPVCQLQ